MLNKLTCGVVLALSSWAACVPATAQQTIEHWNFVWTGFEFDNWVIDPFFDADRKANGTFTGSDLDGDGTLRADELTEFVFWGTPFIGCPNTSWRGCSIEHFAYDTEAGALSFAVSSFGVSQDLSGYRSDMRAVTGELISVYDTQPGDDMWWEYRWTAQTSFALSPAPEPAAPALALAGLAVLAPVLRRRLRACKGTRQGA